MTDLTELAKRVEAATGPDRELDAEIAIAIDLKLPHDDYGARDAARRGGAARLAEMGECHQNVWRTYLPRYTASLDSAMTLVPEGYEWAVNWGGNSVANVNRIGDGYPIHCGCAATPSLALTAAALGARAAMGDG